MARWPGFIGGSYQSAARTADQERTVNMYVERMESRGASVPAALYLVPGLEELAVAASNPGRAHFFESGREFAVFGASFVEIMESGILAVHGAVTAGGQPATICSNGDGGGQLLITSGGNAYFFDLATDTLTAIAALAGKATMGSYLDGFGLVLDGNTSTAYYSAPLDFSSWTTGTDFFQRTKAPDKWKAMRVNGQYIGLYGEHTTEFWYNEGGQSNPFVPHPSGLIPYGIVAPFSLAVGEGTQFWLGQSAVGQLFLMRSSAFQPEVISDFPHQLAFAALTDPAGAVGEVMNWRGHQFYRLSFPGDGVTFCYDASSNTWFEWRTWMASSNAYGACRARFPVVAFGETRVLDAETGAVYRYSDSVHTDADGGPIRWMRRAPQVTEQNQLLFLASFELALEEGPGVGEGQGEDPQVMLRLSRDGGRTWGNERMRPAGRTGEYSRRVRLDRLGAARRPVIEATGTDPVPWKITDAFLRLAQSPREDAA